MAKTTKPAPDEIQCPECGAVIPITETLHHQLTEQARVELRKELAEGQKALQARERSVKEREQALESAEIDLEKRVEERLTKERGKLTKDALSKAREEVAVELKDLEAKATERDKQLADARRKELDLLKEKRALEDAKKALELDVARTLEQEREKIREDATKEALEEYHLKDAEKDRKLQAALKEAESLRRKLQQGSQQTQGEVLEEELEALLKAQCPLDDILPVPKGIRGADVLQRVRTQTGHVCGLILWETKHTKSWSDAWISKAKDDQRDAKADLAVIVTDVLPKDLPEFGTKDGVWITTPRNLIGVIAALRYGLVQVAIAKAMTASKNETVEALFTYLTGPEFRNRVEAIVRSFSNMKAELDVEKRTYARHWAKREKQLELIINNTSGMYGDLQGLLGSAIQPIPALEAGEPGDEAEGMLEEGPPASDEASEEEDLPF